jgi:predicted GH43/DUF377 family glycosyl hydrolase
VPAVRYDDRYARSIGKWMLNAANSMRLFYANGLPENQQTDLDWAKKYDPTSCIAYEGLKAANESIARVKSDYKTVLGIVKSGSFKDTLYTNKKYQVLEESNTPSGDRLEHVWVADIPKANESVINFVAKSTGDEAFKISYAFYPDGPYHPLGVIKSTTNSGISETIIPEGSNLYIKSEDENSEKKSGEIGTLAIDDIWIVMKKGKGPLAGGDAKDSRWAATNLGLYGSSFVGIFGSIIEKTNIEGILQLDCLATDYYHGPAYPTWLYFNPHKNAKEVKIKIGNGKKSLYDAVQDRVIKDNVSGTTSFTIAGNSAALIVVAPAKGKLIRRGNKTLINEVVVDYQKNITRGTNADELPDWAIGPFEKYAGNPVLSPSQTGWDAGRYGGGVHNGSVVVRDETFYYVYRGERETDTWPNYNCKIGLATSKDGKHFDKYVNNPLFGADDKYSYEDVNLVQYEGTYYLFTNRWDWEHVNDTDISGLWLATSKNLINWKEQGLIFPRTNLMHRNGVVLQDPSNQAVKVNGKFIMYLNNGLMAYSEDLIHWQSKKIVAAWPGGECCQAITNYSDQSSENIVLFTGGGHGGSKELDIGTAWGKDHFYAIGEILFSKKNPEEPLDILYQPVLFAEEKYPWEFGKSATDPERTISPFADCIFFNGITKHKGRWWLYYGGSEVYTCLATTPD